MVFNFTNQNRSLPYTTVLLPYTTVLLPDPYPIPGP